MVSRSPVRSATAVLRIGVLVCLLHDKSRIGSLAFSFQKRAVKPYSSLRASSYNSEDYETYSRCMSPKDERRSIQQESQEYAVVDKDRRKKWWRKLFRRRRRSKPGALILLVNGESAWRANRTFTGWEDPPLTEKGRLLSQHAARLLIAEGLQADRIYTSRLTRAIQAARTVIEEWDAWYIPIWKTYRLNARMYGSVQGLSKDATAATLGSSVVQAWRNSLKGRPPPMEHTDPRSPIHDRRYADIVDQIPTSESRLDCHERARPLWEHRIRNDLAAGHNVLVVAHRDALQGIIKAVDHLPDSSTLHAAIPAGVPIVYRFDTNMEPIPSDKEGPKHTSATFLEQPGLLEEALDRDKNWKTMFDAAPSVVHRVSTVERALEQLRREEELLETGAVTDAKKRKEPTTATKSASADARVERWADDPREFEEFEFFANGFDDKEDGVSMNIVPAPEAPQHQEDPVIVFVRHGRTPHNNLGLFTGFQDPPLAPEGVYDAQRAGRLLKRHGFEFDVVYTSQLTRAIQTGSYILDELGTIWLPMIKSWRLNERMYGALTGKSKKMIENEYGKDQLVKWRRGYKIRPPAVSSFSPDYPGNDDRRTKHIRDLRISWSESLARSFEQRKLVIHRKFPKTESLHDCMQRSIPFYTNRIVTEAVAKKKRVLIASHENAIRGILMHLCDIPEEAMQQLHLPNGLPLVYNVRGKCITLLEDDLEEDDAHKTTAHDFGPAAKYLFRPCELDDSFFEEMAQKGQQNEKTKEPTPA